MELILVYNETNRYEFSPIMLRTYNDVFINLSISHSPNKYSSKEESI